MCVPKQEDAGAWLTHTLLPTRLTLCPTRDLPRLRWTVPRRKFGISTSTLFGYSAHYVWKLSFEMKLETISRSLISLCLTLMFTIFKIEPVRFYSFIELFKSANVWEIIFPMLRQTGPRHRLAIFKCYLDFSSCWNHVQHGTGKHNFEEKLAKSAAQEIKSNDFASNAILRIRHNTRRFIEIRIRTWGPARLS